MVPYASLRTPCNFRAVMIELSLVAGCLGEISSTLAMEMANDHWALGARLVLYVELQQPLATIAMHIAAPSWTVGGAGGVAHNLAESRFCAIKLPTAAVGLS